MDPQVAFLLQLALILATARALGELLRLINQPPVLGELMAGIVLGPTVLGALWPDGFHALFSDTAHLQTLSIIGLALLMLLTGLETDVRMLRNLGRAAFMASFFGMLIPFASGLALGGLLPEAYAPGKVQRLALMLFMGTAMGISAMPVIAKILIDLQMIKRDFGLLTLSAAVVDDTVGWIVLAVISGLVTTGSFEPDHVFRTLLWLAAFLAFARYALYPVLRLALPHLDNVMRMPGGELVVIFCVTMLCAGFTEAIHVHAVFGAFVAGVVFRQCPTLASESLGKLESVTMSLFAPLFFGVVGLGVDLWKIQGFWLPVLVISIAIAGKIAGCFLGGILGRQNRWMALALGFCMSARGAMGLVVAKVGHELGILDVELYSCIVLMAVVTSFLAPILIKLIAHKIPLNEDEKQREKSSEGRFVPTGQLKILVPASGGPNALLGGHLAAHLCRTDGDRCTALYVEPEPLSWWQGLAGSGRGKRHIDAEAVFKNLKEAAGAFAARLTPRKTPVQESVSATILAEAAKGCHFLVMGASGEGHPVYDPFIAEIVKKCPCHLVVVAGREGQTDTPKPMKRILVPTNGSYVSDAAFDLAAAYAEAAGAALSVLYVSESRNVNPLLPAAAISPLGEHVADMMRVTLKEQFSERFPHPERLECHVREGESVISGLVDEVHRGQYDLVVLGAENKSLVERLYLGPNIEAAMLEVPCAVAILIPKVGAKR
ncbi:MAG: cation:proton antiporter [Planctomycetes bacterium]|nr:cation:proton antiporter [Planctomycetota bacterium]